MMWRTWWSVRRLYVFPVAWVVKGIKVVAVWWGEWVEVSLVVGGVVKLEVRGEDWCVDVGVVVSGW